MLLNGDGLLGLMFQSMYATSIIPMLPRLIYDCATATPMWPPGLQGEFLSQYDKINVGMQLCGAVQRRTALRDAGPDRRALKQHPDYAALGSRGIIEYVQSLGRDPPPIR